MKKILLIIVLMFTLLSLTSCGNNNTENTNNQNNTNNKGDNIEKTGKRVYFAGPMFNQGEKDFNLKIVTVLEEFGYEVFLPQRDGIEAALLEGKTEDELIEMIFALDESEVLKADILFMNIDGRAPDEGACVELGIAYANGKRCYGFKTDTRSVEKILDINPMITGCMLKLFVNYDGDALAQEIREYLTNNAL